MALPRAGFIEGALQFRGNVHGHSTLSDGRLDPGGIISRYRDRGYDFFALSDHNRYFDTTEFDTSEFLVLPAVEYSVREPKDGIKGHHLHGIRGTDAEIESGGDRCLQHGQVLERFAWRSPHTVERAAQFLRNAGLLVMYNHPDWSRLEVTDLLNATSIFAVEIYNHGSEVAEALGVSTPVWDLMLRRGRRVYGLATDDVHHCPDGDPPDSDAFGGWIKVDAPQLTRNALATALSQGHFYSSTGPDVLQYGCDGKRVVIECSPVRAIRFITFERRGAVRFGEGGRLLRGGEFELHGDESFLRVECVDEDGKVAWTNPIFPEDL